MRQNEKSCSSDELYQTCEQGTLGIDSDNSAWFTWLEQVSSFAFADKSGHSTARKEARQRGERYWYAYLATGERLTKKISRQDR